MTWLIYFALAVINAFWLRRLWAPLQRLNDLNWQALVTLDVIAAFILFWPAYVVGLLTDRPLPWTTISTMCGAYALAGRRWARLGQALIDPVFLALTSQPNHCLNSYLRWRAPHA